MSEASSDKPGYMASFAIGLGEGQSLTVAFNFPIGATKSLMDAELDKVYAVLERQRAKVLSPIMEEKIKQAKDQLEEIHEQISVAQDATKALIAKGKPTNGQSSNHVEQLYRNAKMLKRNIEEGVNEVAMKRAIIGQIQVN